MQTISSVRAAGLACFPCGLNKAPLTKQDWRKAATVVHEGNESNIGGLPVPTGVLVIDLDLYKGVTQATANKALKSIIPWQQSLIQITQRGGEHHAFRVNFDINQRSNYPIEGLDTKVAGKGYICFGSGYTAANGSGVLRLLNISDLPELPIIACEILKKTVHVKKFSDGSIDIKINDLDLREALKHISPWCDREEWLSVGMALKTHFGASEECFNLFNNWSYGKFSNDKGVPKNYDPGTQFQQWNSFRIDGRTTINTIFYKARKNGWKPMHKYAELIGKLPPPTPYKTIGISPPPPIPYKTIGISPPPPNAVQAPPPPNATASNIMDVEDIPYSAMDLIPGKSLHNAKTIIHHGLENRILRIDGYIRWWSGKEWQQFPEGKMDRFLWECLPFEMDKASAYNNIRQAFLISIDRKKPKQPCKRIFYKDVVVNSVTGETTRHDRDNLNYGTLSVNWSLETVIVKWESFLNSIFDEGDGRKESLQEIFGWFLITHNLGIEKYIAFMGVPRAGKGTTLRVLMKILGDEFCSSFNFNTLGSPHSHEILRKCNVAIDLDAKIPAKQDRSEAAATLLKATANESMSSRQFFKTESIQGPMNVKIVIACNNVPALLDDSGASASRVIILPFDKSFTDIEQFGLYDELISELPGIVNWARIGLERLKRNNYRFTQPASSIEQQNDLKNNSQPLNEFIEEYIVFDPDGRCFTSELYKAFKTYSLEVDFPRMSRIVFIKALKETLLSKRIKWGNIRIGDENKKGAMGISIKYPGSMFSVPSPMQ